MRACSLSAGPSWARLLRMVLLWRVCINHMLQDQQAPVGLSIHHHMVSTSRGISRGMQRRHHRSQVLQGMVVHVGGSVWRS